MSDTQSTELMDNLMAAIRANGTQSDSLEVTDLGQISKMELPPGWEEGLDEQSRQHAATYRHYHPVGEPECQIGFYYRGRRTSDAAGRHFLDVLNKPPHKLTRQEFDSLGDVVRDKSEPEDFQVTNVRTIDISGKVVLLVEGRYKDIQQDSKHIFIDADGSGTAVQEIFFQAPKERFPVYAKLAEQSMKSIQWK